MIKRGFKRLRVEQDFPSEHILRTNGLYNQVPILTDMTWITKCSFIAHKSLDCLDLSLHENSHLSPEKCVDARLVLDSDNHPFYNKFVNTHEKFRKAVIPDRKVLYTFHLDPPKDRESSLKVVADLDCVTVDTGSIFCDSIYLTDHDYKESIRKFVQLSFMRHDIKTNRMRGLLRLIKHVVSFEVPLRPEERNVIFRIMSQKCTDPDVAREFISMHNFTQWFFCYYKTEDLDFIVRNARQTTYVIELNHCVVDAINWYIACSKYKENLEILLRYQDQPSFQDFDYKLTIEACIKSGNFGTYVNTWHPQLPFHNGDFNIRRHFLLLQILRVFFDRKRGVDKKCLRILWRALPDAFFTSDEMMFVSQKLPDPVSLEVFYKEIAEDDISDHKPRSLQHYSRVTIRKLLCRNKMLPEGIFQLGLGRALQAYLRLEI